MLLGREREQLTLGRVLDDGRAGSSKVLAIAGEAGIGKSALLAYAEEQARDMQVLRARGVQSEAHIPFAGLFELLRPALTCIGQIPSPQAAALESALALRPAQAQDRFAVGAATLSLLASYADAAPVAVLIDDAHWLDESSANACLFAFRRLLADPIAVVLTVREGEPSLLDGADLPTMRLQGLDRTSAGELLRRLGDEPLSQDLADRLHHDTGGNPLALLELGQERTRLTGLPPDAPLATGTSVAGVYLIRFRSLPQRTRDVLVLAAAIDSGEVSVLARSASILGLDLSDLAPAEAAGLIAIHNSHVQFRHPLARSAIYGDAPADRRREVHRALAAAFPDAEADRRAWHLALASFGPDDATSSALEQAGHRARARSAYEVSSHAFERAALLAPEAGRQGRLLYAAADTAWLGGQTRRAAALLTGARQRALTPDLAIAVEHLRGHIATRRGPIAEAQEILLTAAEDAAQIDPERAVVILAEALNASFYAGDAATMRLAAEALRLSRDLGLGVCEVWAIAALGDLEVGLGQPEAALAQFEQQQALLRSLGIGDVDISPAPELVEIYLRLGRNQDAAEAAAEYERAATAKAQPWALARAARCRGLLAAQDSSEPHFEAALILHGQTSDAFETGRTRLALGSRLRRERQRIRAREHLRAAVDVFDRLGADPWSEMARAELAATGESVRRRDQSALSDLTPQELQIAVRLAAGRTTREAATALFLSPKTIEYHLRNIYRKLAVSSRSELTTAMQRLD